MPRYSPSCNRRARRHRAGRRVRSRTRSGSSVSGECATVLGCVQAERIALIEPEIFPLMGDDELFSLVRNGKPMAPGTPSCQSLTWPMPKHRP